MDLKFLKMFVVLTTLYSNPEQKWLIPQPTRNLWGDKREFNKVNLVQEIMGYKPRINNKDDAKCIDMNLCEAPESDLVISKLRKIEDYLPVNTPRKDTLDGSIPILICEGFRIKED